MTTTLTETVITVKDLHKRYGEKVAVDSVSFDVRRGEIFGILGPNGAGKTTTVECLTGLRSADSGQLSLLGLDSRRDVPELRRRVGVQLQESELPPKLTVTEALELWASFYDEPADGVALATRLGLGDKLATQYRHLSGGQKQRLAIALALIGNPEVAVLDELTTGLDPQARREVWGLIEAVRDSGVTIVLVTHFMDEAQRLCDRIALIDDGRVVALDTPKGIADLVRAGQVVRFRVPDLADRSRITVALATVSGIETADDDGDLVTVRGGKDVVVGVVLALAAAGVTPTDVEVDKTSLEDAFVALTRTEEEN